MTVEELLARAQSQVGQPIHYKLGAGGMSPRAASPAAAGLLDCSGLVSWAIGRSRKTSHPLYVRFNGGWLDTNGIVHDATTCTGFFDRLDGPRVGAVVVFPRNTALGRPVGHCGLVSAVSGGQDTRVIHCSAGNDRRYRRAVLETDPDVFRVPDVVYAWYGGLDI